MIGTNDSDVPTCIRRRTQGGTQREYLFERFEREGNLGEEQIVNLSTHRIPIGIAYFHPIGPHWTGVKATIVRSRRCVRDDEQRSNAREMTRSAWSMGRLVTDSRSGTD